MSTTDNRQLRQSLLDAYEALPPLEQAVVQLLSVIYEEVGKTALADCARRCDAPQIKAKGFPQPGLMPLLERLVSSKLVIQANNQWLCHRLIVEDITRRAVRESRFESMAKAVQEVIRTSSGWSDSYFRSYRQALAGLRIAFYRGDMARMQRILEACVKNYPTDLAQYPPWLLIFNNPFDADSLRALPDELLGEALAAIFAAAARHFEPADELAALAESLLAGNRCADALRYDLAEQALLRGEPAKARQYLGPHQTDYSEALRGWLAFLDGNDEQAIQHYEAALKLLRKRTGKRKIFFDHLAGVFFILALLASNTPARLRQALDMMAPVFDKGARYAYPGLYRHLWQVVEVQQGQLQKIAPPNLSAPLPALDRLFQLLVLFWLKAADPQALRGLATILLGTAQENGYHWFAAELAQLVRQLGGPADHLPLPPTPSRHGEGEPAGKRHLARLFQLREPWEHALNALLELTKTDAEPTAAPANRLVWWIRWHKSGSCTLSPREQKRDARGQWTQGRPVALKRLHHAEKLEFLTPQDREICSTVRVDYSGYYGQTSYEIDTDQALPLLVGHPLVFWEDTPGVRVDLVRGEPELLITPQGSQWRLELSPKAMVTEPIKVVKETPTRLKVIAFNEAHKQVMNILGEGLLVPGAAKARVLETVAALANLVTVQSSIGGGVENLEEVAADALPHVHLLPFGEGLKIELRVRPFATGGPSYRPGAGGEWVIAEIEGKRVQARRDLKLERRRVAQVVTAVPSLSRQPTVGGEWILPDPEACLEALLELQALGDQAVLEWPEGEKFKVSRPATLGQLRLSIKRHRDWFDLDGELRLDEQVFNMRQLLELLERAPGRFLPLGDGRFLALTDEFRRRLEELRGFGEPGGKGVRFHPLAAPMLEPLAAEAGTVRADADWKAQIQRLREAEALQPAIPSTLQAELRDYQAQGFEWLARLAHWGVGACLADDMGLGKTVQALTLILNRAQDGPALVVAPTSVCLNWVDEIRRFTPTLNPIVFGSGDREQTLARLGPFDLLICSYGLLQQEAERLVGREWQTIVLDEAQAIKNMTTKRSQAAMVLRGDFRMITTGGTGSV